MNRPLTGAPDRAPVLILDAQLPDGSRGSVRLRDGRIEALGVLSPAAGERVVEARGGVLLPGLHDHHVHLFALAAARESVDLGPPAVRDETGLAAALEQHAVGSTGWIRGIGYHESVAGELDRWRLDRYVPDVPIRIQHRSGRLWIFNSAGLERLTASAVAQGLALPVDPDTADGQFYDADESVRKALAGQPPDLAPVSRALAACGVTGVTDMTPHNDPLGLEHFHLARCRGDLKQRLLLAGRLSLSYAEPVTGVAVGPVKFHLHEHELPPFDTLCGAVREGHEYGRTAAFHCVTETELVYALAAVREAGAVPGDRIEHASLAPDPLIGQIRDLGLTVVTQPNFVQERGDAYLRDVPVADHPHLYRVGSFLNRGVPLAAGSDAPFGTPDPWLAMRSAVDRRTASGTLLAEGEAISPEQALALFTGPLEDPAESRQLEVGGDADLVLLDRPWERVRASLSRERVRLTIRAGEIIYERSPDSRGG